MSGAKESVPGGVHSTAGPQRDRKAAGAGGGVLKRLKSRRSQVDSRPVTEEDLRTQGAHITPEDVLGLRVATRGLSPPVVPPVVALMPPGQNDTEPWHQGNQKWSRCCRISGPIKSRFPFQSRNRGDFICDIWGGNRRHEATFDSWKNPLFYFIHHQGDGK